MWSSSAPNSSADEGSHRIEHFLSTTRASIDVPGQQTSTAVVASGLDFSTGGSRLLDAFGYASAWAEVDRSTSLIYP